ncbi:MAG: EAL domain-containing protein [Vibrio sp.]
MTLYQKFLLWLSATLFVLMASLFVLQFNNTHDHLAEQQEIALTNTISAINIAVTPYMQNKDFVGVESVINASFDSGFYGNITLKMNDGSKTLHREDFDAKSNAPEWFTKIAPFKELSEERVLMDGWLQVATLTVTSSNETIYNQLWELTLKLLSAFAINFIIAAITLSLVLRVMLKPLKNIQQRANEISQNQFGDPIPDVNTRELSDVVQAMNFMSKHIEEYYHQSVKELQRLRLRAYQDPVSKLSNRDFFISQLEPWLDMSEGDHCGVLLIRVDTIDLAYQNKQFEFADKLVKTIADEMAALVDGKNTIARFNKAEFILLVPHCRYDYLERISQTALDLIQALPTPDGVQNSAAIGMLVINEKTDTTTVFTKLDNALTQARQQSGAKKYMIDDNSLSPEFTKGKMEWQNLVEQAIETDCVKLKFQAAVNKERQKIQYEAFAYIEMEGTVYPANLFITAIENEPIATLFDTHVLTLIANYLEQNQLSCPIAINITHYSVQDPLFTSFLEDRLPTNPQFRDKVLFELPEIGFVKNGKDFHDFTNLLAKNGFKFGIDNFGHNFGTVDYLTQTRPHYVKLDYAYTTQVDDPAKFDVLASIARIANNLGVETIATRVETLEQAKQLSALKVYGFQGYITDTLD